MKNLLLFFIWLLSFGHERENKILADFTWKLYLQLYNVICMQTLTEKPMGQLYHWNNNNRRLQRLI